jgi:hypothetical protein
MFANLFQLVRPPSEPGRGFVEEVVVRRPVPRNLKLERLMLVCWVLIAIKHVGIIWVCQHYPVPFHQLWVNFPTWLLGALATGIYYGRVWRR